MSEPVKFVQWGKAAKTQPAPATPAPAAEQAPTPGTDPPLPAAPPAVAAPTATAPTRTAPGYTRFPNDFWDRLVPTLDPYEVLVLGQLIRLTVGFQGRPRCTIGLARLGERTNLGENTVRRAVRRLEARGLISRPAVANTGANETRGTVYEVRLAPAATAPASAAPAAAAPMKDSETKNESAPDRFEIRQAAARLRESEPALPRAELVTAVRRAFTAGGRAVTEGEIEDAIRGLAL